VVKRTFQAMKPDPAFLERLAFMFDLLPTRKRAAEVAGVSDDMIPAYLSGVTHPRFQAIQRLAAETGVSLDWLATGEGHCFVLDRLVKSSEPQHEQASILELNPADEQFWDKLTARIAQRAEARRG
jgi:hypothetical protein